MIVANKAKIYAEDNFQAFYTDAEEIRLLMLDLLGNVHGQKILEPCAGEGSFIRGLNGIPKEVTAIDIDSKHINILNNVFPAWVKTIHSDFIDQFVSDSLPKENFQNKKYDATICNPPYGLKFSVEYRKEIKKKYPSIYARESYGLFMHFGISLLKNLGRYVFIVPDTFLTSTNHKSLRKFLAHETQLTHIIQFKSKRFETVNFGYGNLCIIAGIKGNMDNNNQVIWVDATKSQEPITHDIFKNVATISGTEFLQNIEYGWIHPDHKKKIKFTCDTKPLGDLTECKTGIYTGDNNRFCAYDEEKPPSRINGHPIQWNDKVFVSNLSSKEKKEGLNNEKHYVPLIRGGHREPFSETGHAINWSNEAVNFYDKDKKARLQNSAYYFRSGLAIPMVTSGRISALLMKNAIFDQGVVGVFPKDDKWLDFLLIYLNSDFVSNVLKKTINPSANNSANYLKRMPVPNVNKNYLSEAQKIIFIAKNKGWNQTKEMREKFINIFVTN
ncbi:hypothetical protein BMR07_15765 [Methylococcaceae bacterium CS1]|nr:hypothetical protein BMR10_09335 [Methylococcaceae bacterium CS4]TXK96601.1 hypothetical protein BMR11_11585 [Methylococcaceae bacterium CS5]TXL03243.1 hypothetical protein BMR07_15765 [Methylococcaceae bacterium CS1]TXL03352.1 hypothetical protein BMR09_15115 [Methylococcaceae bacterium CS3]TXL05957.1 hypothetical protein BMR08_15745 [Methylococcaceae bacterium CS2]